MTEVEQLKLWQVDIPKIREMGSGQREWYRKKLRKQGRIVEANQIAKFFKLEGCRNGGKTRKGQPRLDISVQLKQLWQDPEYRDKMFPQGHNIKVVCTVCGTAFEVAPYREGQACFCSLECRNVGLVGERTSNWRGGISFEPYCPKFNETLKEKIRNRDNRTCQLCGKGEIEESRRLSIHHIDGDKMQGCGKPWYLISLCSSCHSSIGQNIYSEFELLARLGRR